MKRNHMEKELGFKLNVDAKFTWGSLVYLPNDGGKYLIDLHTEDVNLAEELFGYPPKGESIRFYVKSYCTQNGICETCSLASYNKDCQNNEITLKNE